MIQAMEEKVTNEVSKILELTSVQGRIISLGEIDKGKRVNATVVPVISRNGIKTINAYASISFKNHLKECLFNNVRLRGLAVKRRDVNRHWKLTEFHIQKCTLLKAGTFSDFIFQLRAGGERFPRGFIDDLINERYL